MQGMRHTVFVFPTALTVVVHASTGLAVAARERATLVKDLPGRSRRPPSLGSLEWEPPRLQSVLAVMALVNGPSMAGDDFGIALSVFMTLSHVIQITARREGKGVP